MSEASNHMPKHPVEYKDQSDTSNMADNLSSTSSRLTAFYSEQKKKKEIKKKSAERKKY